MTWTLSNIYPLPYLCCLALLGADICCIVFGPCGVYCTQMSQFGFTAGRTISRKTGAPRVHPHHFPNWSCLEFSGAAMGSLCWDSTGWIHDKLRDTKLSMMTKCLCKQRGRTLCCLFIKRFPCLSSMPHLTELPTYWVVCMMDAPISCCTATCVWVKSPEARFALNAFDFYSSRGSMQLLSWSLCISAPLYPSLTTTMRFYLKNADGWVRPFSVLRLPRPLCTESPKWNKILYLFLIWSLHTKGEHVADIFCDLKYSNRGYYRKQKEKNEKTKTRIE